MRDLIALVTAVAVAALCLVVDWICIATSPLPS